jgi:hypothetical protein
VPSGTLFLFRQLPSPAHQTTALQVLLGARGTFAAPEFLFEENCNDSRGLRTQPSPIGWLLFLLARMIPIVNQYLKSSKDARKRSDIARTSSERHSGDLRKMKKTASDALDHVTQCTKRQDQREARELRGNRPAEPRKT